MTREEAIQDLKDILEEATSDKDAVCYVTSEDAEALNMAIEALSAETVHIETYRELYEKYVELKHASADAVQGWIPFKRRPLTDEEQQEYPDWAYIFDCLLPDDEEEILLSNGKHVWTDTFINDGECYLDGGDDIDDGMAWMPLPTPYKESEVEE